jgi:hypothetical protein
MNPVSILLFACKVNAIATRCHYHEEVRGTKLVVVDCYGSTTHTVSALDHGVYKYQLDGHLWSSRDRSMQLVDTGTKCDPLAQERFTRCLQVPSFYVFCHQERNSSCLMAMGDGDLPRENLMTVLHRCNSKNSTLIVRPRAVAKNIIDVENFDKAKDDATFFFLSLLGIIVLCVICCNMIGKTKRYSRLT